jgi:predicted ATPase
MSNDYDLHLAEFSMSGFRGINELAISRLGRVTLLAGVNSVGKTTVLDAVRVYAARGRYSVLSELLRDRQEVADFTDEDGDRILALDWASLFYGRNPTRSTGISIGPANMDERVNIHVIDNPQEERFPDQVDSIGLKVTFRKHEPYVMDLSSAGRYRSTRSRRSATEDEPPPAITCEYLGPGMLSERHTSRLWDSVALTEDETRVQAALDLVVGNELAGIAMVGDGASRTVRDVRRVIVRLKGQDRPVPLRSLGDGAVRLFGIAVALANSRGGFLLIDEAENGIHHSVQLDLWKMILRTAQANDVQVLATTHSWDCVRGFAYAAAEYRDADGVLVRLDRDDRELRAVEYSEEDLKIAAEQGIEVR